MNNFLYFFTFIFLISCSRNEGNSIENPQNQETPQNPKILEIKGADLSFLPELRQSGVQLLNSENQTEDALLTLKKAGVNVIRLRLWKNPATPNSSFETVKNLAQEIKSKGMKVLLSVHYSDSWADPSQQKKPQKWDHISFASLQDSVAIYTRKIVTEINPEYIQIGNEINSGFLFPEGSIQNLSQMKTLLNVGISAVKSTNANTKVILHFAGFQNANSFFTNVADLNYDIIGISYYPNWHGKSLTELQQNLEQISNSQNKPIFIAETAYPFTMSWNDQTHNVIGNSSQILSEFSATETGQKNYLLKMKKLITAVPKGIGFCYWGSEWVSYKGQNATDGSSWENQAFWGFNHKILPVSEAYK